MTKPELLEILTRGEVDPEASHKEAEDALVAYVNDPHITAAWKHARYEQNWWYA